GQQLLDLRDLALDGLDLTRRRPVRAPGAPALRRPQRVEPGAVRVDDGPLGAAHVPRRDRVPERHGLLHRRLGPLLLVEQELTTRALGAVTQRRAVRLAVGDDLAGQRAEPIPELL